MERIEAGVDLVLIQPFLFYYVNHVVSDPNWYFLNIIFIRREKRFDLLKQGQPQPYVHSKAGLLSSQL